MPKWPTIAASTSKNVGSAGKGPSVGTATRRICLFRFQAWARDTMDDCASEVSSGTSAQALGVERPQWMPFRPSDQ